MSEEQNSLLRAALQFDVNDLEANRRGIMSEQQSQALWEKRIKEVAPAAIIIPVLVYELWSMWQRLTSPLAMSVFFSSTMISVVLSLFVVGLTIFVAKYYSRRWQRYSLDLRNSRIESVEGQVIQNPKQRGRYTSYSIIVAGREFTVPGRVMLAFQNGAVYRVYFAPSSATVVSAERLD